MRRGYFERWRFEPSLHLIARERQLLSLVGQVRATRRQVLVGFEVFVVALQLTFVTSALKLALLVVVATRAPLGSTGAARRAATAATRATRSTCATRATRETRATTLRLVKNLYFTIDTLVKALA